MEALKKERKVLRCSFTRAVKDLEEKLAAAGPGNRQEISIAWTLVNGKFEILKQKDQAIFSGLLAQNESEENLSAEIESTDVYLRTRTGLKLRHEEFLREIIEDRPASGLCTGTGGPSSVSEPGKRSFKLPRIELKPFGGEIRDWLAFWSQFSKIDADPDIDLHDKIAYLSQATIPGSRARRVVESFPPMRENYSKIVDCLKARFGREDLQIEVYVRELLKLIMGNCLSPNKLNIAILYDKIETQLRALETLGITKDKCAAMLYPLIESCLPEGLIRVWQRSSQFSGDQVGNSEESSLEARLNGLLSFIRLEVEGEQRITLATEGLGLMSASNNRCKNREPNKTNFGTKVPTASGLANCEVSKNCIFCDGAHSSEACFKAQKFTLEKRKDILRQKRSCFRCLRIGHMSKECRVRIFCRTCGKGHASVMCTGYAHANTKPSKKQDNSTTTESDSLANHCSSSGENRVYLQTLRVNLRNGNRVREVRCLIDSGSQRSYILKSTAEKMGFEAIRDVRLSHNLFGGTVTSPQVHKSYRIELAGLGTDNVCGVEVLDQDVICGRVEPVPVGPLTQSLRAVGIHLTDEWDGTTRIEPIEVLLGADCLADLYTGKQHLVTGGLVVLETYIGWTVMGKSVEKEECGATVFSTLALHTSAASVEKLWDLDIIGIRDPIENKTRAEKEQLVENFFRETIRKDADNRYEVRLPWLEEHPPLPENYGLAAKRLENTLKKLKEGNLLQEYNYVFQEWLNEGIIEVVPDVEVQRKAHYLPHRPVIKECSTTKLRPVFNASAKEKDKPSLNECLHPGPNLIEQIPDILLRFRLEQVGVVSDIRKAFLQISLHETDRDFLRFMWIDSDGKKRIYRHKRVVFGVNSSPYLLGATIAYHLSTSLAKCGVSDTPYSQDTIEKLSGSFYVDNCVTSLPNQDSLGRFMKEASALMAEGQFELRGWEHSHNTLEECSPIPVLGLTWNPKEDTLSISENCFRELKADLKRPITKRLILSIAQRIYDPVGFTCPVTLCPKLLLQKMWDKRIGWDEIVDEEAKNLFLKWVQELPDISKIEIPRWVHSEGQRLSLHTFCDASKDAYSAAVYLRTIQDDRVHVFLVAAKTRISPLKKTSIPRLELLAATIASRLFASVRSNFGNREIDCHFYSDSATVISWIRRAEQWSTFVWNRVVEIRKLSPVESWRHLPGSMNPADLPSRGCTVAHLLKSRWWEGPHWLSASEDHWPQENLEFNEEEISSEKRKKQLTTALLNVSCDEMHLTYFSKYNKTVRLIAWIFRFIHNLRNHDHRRQGTLSLEEIERAEDHVFKLIQRESFEGKTDPRIRSLNPFCDQNGIIRVRSQVSNRRDDQNFRHPILLPAKHPVVNRLISDLHERSLHVGTQGLLNLLREKFWILGGRRSVRAVISKCVTCKRQEGRPFVVEAPPLPENRVRDAVAFEVIGVDLCGPLFLRNGTKVWVGLFTCAVYRAVHLELASSLSTSSFLQMFRRFVGRRGRPRTIYSDRGTNFVGINNAFEKLDWDLVREHATVQRITWNFNPPTAAWWGGFFERLIGSVKRLLKKVLGRASLNYEDLLTLLCECEQVINSRPLTYLSENASDPMPLTPAMFIRDQAECGLPDCDEIDRTSLRKKMAYKQQLRETLRKRFRIEYLGQLKQSVKCRPTRAIMCGELVLIGNDVDKRVRWPMGRVEELIPGRDGRVRVARVSTNRGQLLRPVQRLYPLECVDVPTPASMAPGQGPNDNVSSAPAPEESDSARVFKSRAPVSVPRVTRCGRKVILPKRFR